MKHILKLIIILFSSYCFSQHSDVPKNLEPGKCFIRFMGENNFSEWREIKCNLLNTYQDLAINLTKKTNNFSKKDKKKINRKIIKLVDKGYVVELRIHHDSKETDSINSNISVQKSQVLSRYLDSLKINPKKIIISSLGSSQVKDKCKSETEDCSKLFAKNSKVEYKVIGLNDGSWYYDNKKGVWCKSKE